MALRAILGEVPTEGRGADVKPGMGEEGEGEEETSGTHLSRVRGTLPLGQWSCRHPQCFGTSGCLQPGPAPGTGPSPHPWAGPQPQPRHPWCSPPGGGSQCRRLSGESHGGQCLAGPGLLFCFSSPNTPVTIISCLSEIGSRPALALRTPRVKQNITVSTPC